MTMGRLHLSKEEVQVMRWLLPGHCRHHWPIQMVASVSLISLVIPCRNCEWALGTRESEQLVPVTPFVTGILFCFSDSDSCT